MIVDETTSLSTLDAHEVTFVEQAGLRAQKEGQPRISGQIWAVLILADRPPTASEIARVLEVSKASVSTNTRLLEERGLIRKVTQAGKREQHYSLVKGAYAKIAEKRAIDFEDRLAFIRNCRRHMTNARTLEQLGELERFLALQAEKLHEVVDALKADKSEAA